MKMENMTYENANIRNDDNCARTIMSHEFLAFPSGIRAKEAFEELRSSNLDSDALYTLYVVDSNNIYIGAVELKDLLFAPEDSRIDSLVSTDVPPILDTDSRVAAAKEIRRYDVPAVPVVDKDGYLLGVITVDDAIDVIEEENTEDFQMLAAMTPNSSGYMNSSVLKLAWHRLPWLMIMMFSAIITERIIAHFEGLLMYTGALGITLVAAIPMLMDSGGNSGSQTSTTIVRALALDQVELRDIFTVLWKEFRVSVTCGACMAVVSFCCLTLILRRPIPVSMVIGLSMFLTIVLSKGIGAVLPMAAKAAHLDPALTASPLITTIVDVCSLLILFGVVSALLV